MPSGLNAWVTPPREAGKHPVSNSRRMPRALNVLKRLTRSVGRSKSATASGVDELEGGAPMWEQQPRVTEAEMDVSVEATLSSQQHEEEEASLSVSAGSSRRSTGSMYSRNSVAGLERRRSEGDEGEGEGGRPCVTGGSGDEVADMSLGSNSRGGDSDDSLVGVVEQQPGSLRDVKVAIDGELRDEGRDVCPDELQPRRPSRRGSLESRARSTSRNSEGRVSSEGRPSGSRQSWEMRESYGSYGRPSWERPSLEYDSRPVSTEGLARMPPPATRSEEWSHVFQGNAAKGVVSGEARGSKVSEHSFYSRSSAEVPFEAVLSSALYSEQAELPSMSPLSRRASANDACNSAELSSDERPYRSHELRRQGKAAGESKPVSKSSFTTPQGYVDSLSLEEEAAAIVAPATKLAIAADGMKYRNLARCASDRHAHHRQRATDAQLARLAFNLPSVRDVEHRRCRTEFRGGVVPQ